MKEYLKYIHGRAEDSFGDFEAWLDLLTPDEWIRYADEYVQELSEVQYEKAQRLSARE